MNWTIKARVLAKKPIHNWQNVRNQGKLFSMMLMDKSGKINATAYNECVEKYYSKIQVKNSLSVQAFSNKI